MAAIGDRDPLPASAGSLRIWTKLPCAVARQQEPGGFVPRLSAADFMAQVLAEAPVQELPPALRKRLLEVAGMPPSARVRELQKAFEEAARG